jgi:hypothetical protein
MADSYIPGWVDDPAAVEAIAQLQPLPEFGNTEAGQDSGPIPSRVFLWDVAKKITGSILPPYSQGNIGSCVSFGTARAVQYSMLGEILNGEPEDFRQIVEEAIYGLARVEIGGGRIRGDGAVGAYGAQAVKDFGILDRAIHGQHDLRKYSEATCRDWGNKGLPDDLEPIAKMYPVKNITRVRTWDEAKRALANLYGIAVCSSQGFTMERDKNGFAKPRGTWQHCMCLDGYNEDGNESGHFKNSWGAHSHIGPEGIGDPGPCGFWADSEVIDKMLRSGDCWAFSGVQGFQKKHQRIDWSKV